MFYWNAAHRTSIDFWLFFGKKEKFGKKAIATDGSFSGMFAQFVANIVRADSRTNAPRACYLWIYFNFSLATTSAPFQKIEIACESKERNHKQQEKREKKKAFVSILEAIVVSFS